MTEIWFYHLQRQTLENVLPGLIEKCLSRGWRVVVQAQSGERLEAIDHLLWTYSDASFLAHGSARDGDASLQPIYLSTGPENPNGAAVRFFIERAPISPALGEPRVCAYTRAINVFDGADDGELTNAREQWRQLKERGFAMAYWRQDETGRWEKAG